MKRFVVLRFRFGWAVWDNLRSRFADGTYTERQDAIDTASDFNADPSLGDRDWFGEWQGRKRTIFSDES